MASTLFQSGRPIRTPNTRPAPAQSIKRPSTSFVRTASGRGQLEQTLAHNDELVSHFQNLGDRSGFLITHEVRPIDSSQARHQAPLAGKIKKTSSFKNRYCLWLF